MLSRFAFGLLAAAAAVQTVQCQVVETSEKEDTSGLPRVVFFRPRAFSGSFSKFAVYCDLVKVAQLPNHTYFEIALSPGTHTCSAVPLASRVDTDIETAFKDERELTLEVKAGAKQWVSVRLKKGWATNSLKLTLERPADARRELEKKRINLVEPGEQMVRAIHRTPVGSQGK